MTNVQIEYQSTFDKCLLSGINLFVGAGFSVLAEDRFSRKLPVGGQLKDELLKEFNVSITSLQLPSLCTLISNTKNKELNEYLCDRFYVNDFNPVYNNIGFIEIKNIFTTNVDNLFEKIFSLSSTKYINDVSLYGASIKEKRAIDCFHLHGSVLDRETKMRFGDLDIASAFSSDPNKWSYLVSVMDRFPTLFWGYALKDAATLEVFSRALELHIKNDSWIVVNPDDIDSGEMEYYKSLGLKIIKSDTESLLKYLVKFNRNKGIVEPGCELSHPLPEYSVPSHSDIKHRSISDYFLGANPDWSDIYSRRVTRVHFYDEIKEVLNKGKNVLITGGPASGKTTLLMQLAAFYEFSGIKFYINSISKEKAQTILLSVGNRSVMFFIDEFQSSFDALDVLIKIRKACFVFAERDYIYLSASRNAFLSKSMHVIDVTEISEVDVQKIIESIPVQIKNINAQRRSDGDSLFELVEKNCKNANIKKRFENVIYDLRKKDERLVELFLLICYMHSSRSVASMDVIISYFAGKNTGYREIYDLIDILGSSISEYFGGLAETDQDYFNIRSNMLADLIYKISPVRDLAKMLTVFYDNVSKYCIPNYESFKRKAYDARLFERAFINYVDGIRVYDIIYKKHGSPFNLQQKALYLSYLGIHEEAFKVIDDAIALSGSKNWAIKNSYAIIKFRANIDRDKSADVRKALDDSMRTLAECHELDLRKTYHALKYADHAMRYYDKYRDEKSLQYLEKAKEWLSEERDSNNNVANVNRSLHRVNSILSRCA